MDSKECFHDTSQSASQTKKFSNIYEPYNSKGSNRKKGNKKVQINEAQDTKCNTETI